MISVAALNQHVDDSKVHTCWQFPTKILCLLVFGWSYLLIGAAIFSHFEQDNELQAEQQYLAAIDNAIAQGNLTTNQTQVLMNLLDTLDELRSTAVTIGHTDWSFVGSTYFATTAVTTIGYGWIAPKTVGGRLFCIIYSIIGIPLVFYMFAYLGRKMMDIIGFRISSLREGSEYKRKQLQSDSVVLPMLVALFIAFLLIAVFAAGYSERESWTYFEAFYFVFITMTTIGFGDFVPRYRDHALPLILQIFGLFLALSVYSYLLNVAIVLVTKFVHNVTRHGLTRMDIQGNGHIGPSEVFHYCFGRTEDRRLRYQASLLNAILQKDLEQSARAAILQDWGQAVAVGFKHLKLPRGLKLYVMLGGPASGKTLMCQRLARKYHLERIDVEKLILLEVLGETGKGRAIEALIKHGCVLPKQVILDLIITRLVKMPRDTACILDGFPLDVHQARFLEQECKYAERVFMLQCREELLEERLLQQDRTVTFGLRALLGPRIHPQTSQPESELEVSPSPTAHGVDSQQQQHQQHHHHPLRNQEPAQGVFQEGELLDTAVDDAAAAAAAVREGVGSWAHDTSTGSPDARGPRDAKQRRSFQRKERDEGGRSRERERAGGKRGKGGEGEVQQPRSRSTQALVRMEGVSHPAPSQPTQEDEKQEEKDEGGGVYTGGERRRQRERLTRQTAHDVSIEIEDLEESHQGVGSESGGESSSEHALDSQSDTRIRTDNIAVRSGIQKSKSVGAEDERPVSRAAHLRRASDGMAAGRGSGGGRGAVDTGSVASHGGTLNHVASHGSLFFQDMLREIKAASPTVSKKRWRHWTPTRRQSLSVLPDMPPDTSVSSTHPSEVLDEFNSGLLQRWKENKVALRDYFQTHLHEIDAEQSEDETFESLCEAFESHKDSSLLQDFSALSGNFALPGVSYPEPGSARQRSTAKPARHVTRKDKNANQAHVAANRATGEGASKAHDSHGVNHEDGSSPPHRTRKRRLSRSQTHD